MKTAHPLTRTLAAALVLSATVHATNYKLIAVSGQSNSGDWSYWGEGPFPDGVKEWINDPGCDALILTNTRYFGAELAGKLEGNNIH